MPAENEHTEDMGMPEEWFVSRSGPELQYHPKRGGVSRVCLDYKTLVLISAAREMQDVLEKIKDSCCGDEVTRRRLLYALNKSKGLVKPKQGD